MCHGYHYMDTRVPGVVTHVPWSLLCGHTCPRDVTQVSWAGDTCATATISWTHVSREVTHVPQEMTRVSWGGDTCAMVIVTWIHVSKGCHTCPREVTHVPW